MRLESLGTDVALACEAARDATHFMHTAERDAVGYTLTKANTSPATAADFVVQAFVASRLARHFPDDPLVAEEDASALRYRPSGSRGVVDVTARQSSDAAVSFNGIQSGTDASAALPCVIPLVGLH